jgi:malonyl-CoA/methylmalonyl-CoA synthetase
MPLEGVEAKVCDAVTGETLANGEIGVLEVRGDNVFQGYWQMPEKTAEELREDGFFITGDLATQSDDGYITIVGRGKDLIITGGFNVYPKEIETLLDDQPNVLESAVIGVPHPDFGEGVLGIVVPKSGADVDVAQLKAAMAQKLAKFKQPKKIVIMKELPRNTMGKVQKNILRDQFADALK